MLLGKFVLSATLASLVIMTSNAYADVLDSYDVSATYNSGGGSVTGTFTLDTTLDTVTAIDLTVTSSGVIPGWTDSTPSDFGFSQFTGTGTLQYLVSGGPDINHEVYLYFPPAGGSLYNAAFDESAVNDYFCTGGGGNNNCGYDVYGTVSAAAGVSTTPLPAALPLFAGGLGLIGFIGRRKKVKAFSA
jgi:hypothetical protein